MQQRQRWYEIGLVLGVSLGQSAVYSVMSLVDKLTRPAPLSQQATNLNPSLVPDRQWLDLTYQLLDICFDLVPVLLVFYLLSRESPGPVRLLGMDGRRWRFDLLSGFGLAAIIGIPGLGLYYAAKVLGINSNIVPAGLPDVWWAIPVLVLAAAQNAVLEEVIVVGYLVTRLREMWGVWPVVLASALLRGTYHLYQGFGGFIGNAAMGVVFALFFLRYRRLWPLVIAHTLLDVVAFVGYAVFAGKLDWIR